MHLYNYQINGIGITFNNNILQVTLQTFVQIYQYTLQLYLDESQHAAYNLELSIYPFLLVLFFQPQLIKVVLVK